MIQITQSLPHQVSWEAIPPFLRPHLPTTREKVHRLLWNILSILIPILGLIRLGLYGIAYLLRRIFLPAAHHPEALKVNYRTLFQAFCQDQARDFESVATSITTPDGAILNAHLLLHRNGGANTPTTIFFQGNGSLKGMGSWYWLLRQSIRRDRPMNFVVFDYRSVDESTGLFKKSKDLLIDAASVVDWVRKEVKTPDDQIHFYGQSLGGALAVKTCASDARLGGLVVNERSFSTLEKVVNAWKDRLPHLLKPLGSLIVWILKDQELELNAEIDLPKLGNRTLVVYHPHDQVIPKAASLAQSFPDGAFELRPVDGDPNPHCSDLGIYKGARERIGNFLFS